jgi:Ceramidase
MSYPTLTQTNPTALVLTRPQIGLTILALVFGIALGALLFLPAVPQKLAYHAFHDGRSWLGMPNALNVLSNLPFTLIGLLGLNHVLGAPPAALPRDLRRPYLTLFIGLIMTGVGSAYYHWSPDNHTLIWDRLPMTLAFMGLFSAIIGERLSLQLGRRVLEPLVLAGFASVLYWAVFDDLRPYAIVQFYPIVAIPLMLWAFPARFSHGHAYLAAIGCYVVAKVLEDADGHIFAFGHLLSGHTLKHLAAAVGGWCIYRMLIVRRPLPSIT